MLYLEDYVPHEINHVTVCTRAGGAQKAALLYKPSEHDVSLNHTWWICVRYPNAFMCNMHLCWPSLKGSALRLFGPSEHKIPTIPRRRCTQYWLHSVVKRYDRMCRVLLLRLADCFRCVTCAHVEMHVRPRLAALEQDIGNITVNVEGLCAAARLVQGDVLARHEEHY